MLGWFRWRERTGLKVCRVKISYDQAKRALTLAERGLDFDDAIKVYDGRELTVLDDRVDYGEQRFQTIGRLNGRLVMVVWTLREETRHVISMRKCNGREQAKYG